MSIQGRQLYSSWSSQRQDLRIGVANIAAGCLFCLLTVKKNGDVSYLKSLESIVQIECNQRSP